MMNSVPIDTQPFFGLRRSGNHAVLDWIFGHCKSWIHYNDCVLNDGQIETTHVERVGTTSPYALASFEDYDLGGLREHLTCESKHILLLRDPFNMFASRLKMVRDFIEDKSSKFSCLDMISGRAFEMWKRYARAFLAQECLNISFNSWFLSRDYRQDTATQLGFTFSDKKFGSKNGWKHSGGSSFGKIDPLNSYKHLQDDPEFLSFFDEETLFLAETIFRQVPNLKFQHQDREDDLIRSAMNLHIAGQSKIALLCLEPSESTQAIQLREFITRGLIPTALV